MYVRIIIVYQVTLIVFALVECRDEIENQKNGDDEREKQITEKPTSRSRDSTVLVDPEKVNAAVEIFLREYKRQHQTSALRPGLMTKEAEIFEGIYYTSGLLRLNFEFEKEDGKTFASSVLLKLPELGLMHDYATKMLYYAKEKYMYEEVIPLVYDHVPYERPSPHFYGATESNILVLENLREYGYRGKSKGTLLDLSTGKVVWKSLAQFHALSTLQLHRVSESLDSLTVMDRSDSEWVVRVFPPIAKKLKEYVLPSCSQNATAKLIQLIDDVPKAVNLGYFPNENGFDVILHGEAQLFNILFLEEAGRDVKVKFVDFQASRRGSPIIDLMYFSIISLPFELFDEHREDLFRFYVEEFNSVLRIVDVHDEKRYYSLEDMTADFEKHKPFFFFIVCSAGPVLWAGNQKVGGSNGGAETDLDAMLKSQKYITAFNGWTKHFL